MPIRVTIGSADFVIYMLSFLLSAGFVSGVWVVPDIVCC